MAQYRIVCATQEPADQPTTHAHILAVGTGDNPNQYLKYWTLAEVFRAMDNDDTFYTRGGEGGRVAWVEKILCPLCRRVYTIRSTSDAVTDNNLDNLRSCRPPQR